MAKKVIPAIHIPLQQPSGSVTWVWYVFFQWLADNAGKIDLSDYFTKEEITEILSDYYTEQETNTLLSNKVDKTSAPDSLYGTDQDGNQTIYDISSIAPNISVDNETIDKNQSNELEAIGVKNKNIATGATENIYDWIGTLAEYEAQDIANAHPEWLCFITDDAGDGEPVYNKNEVDNLLSTKANIDMDNLTSAGQNIANWSSNVTNCITEIPQDIKLELSSGTLTLKAGSKAYIPNGFEVDGVTPKFDVVTIQNDITTTTAGSATTDLFVFYRDSSNDLAPRPVEACYSGNTQPSVSTTTAEWYDTANNIIKHTSNTGSTWTDLGMAFPLCICSRSDGILTSIKQVFNGFGYIGSTVFALPGVKGLIPNGRNTDGTLKNKEFVLNNVIVNSSPGANNRILILNPTDGGILGRITDAVYISNTKPTITSSAQQQYWFTPAENIIYKTLNTGTSWAPNDTIFAGTYTLNTTFDSFNLKTAFRAVDYNEADFVVAFQRPTYGNGYIWYRKYKSGWVEQGCSAAQTGGNSVQVTFPIPLNTSNGFNVTLTMLNSDTSNVPYILCYYDQQSTGIKVISRYANAVVARSFKWMACGMAA